MPRPRSLRQGFEKAEVLKFLGEGERVASVYVVSRSVGSTQRWVPALEYELFFNITGLSGYYVYLESQSVKTPRIFKSFDRMYGLVREFGYSGSILVYDEEDPLCPIPGGGTLRRPGDK